MPSSGDATRVLETAMRRVAALVSAVAVILMAVGFVSTFLLHDLPLVPGDPAVSPDVILHFHTGWGLWAMSAGILLLALLPMVRVFLSFLLFLRERDVLDVAVALIVLLELLASMSVRG